MVKALVVYDSVTGHTAKMAEAIGDGLSESGVDIDIRHVDVTTLDDLVAADVIVMGSPNYFSNMSAKMKAFVDDATKLWPDEPGQLKDKLGAAFTSFEVWEGGYDLTLLSIIRAMIWHGMIIVGHQRGYSGGVAVEEPDESALADCKKFGARIAYIAKRYYG